jgi:MFS family permease
MTDALALLKTDARARLFFGALAQSSLGTGAAYPALLVIGYGRFHSPWAISLILLADFVPSMLAGPLLGAAVDRWPRLWCAVVADVVRAVAFVGIALVGTFEATIGLALLAGVGTALFKPAALAGMPSIVGSDRTAPATSLYGAIADFGLTGGPAIAAVAFLFVGADELLFANGVTFAISAVALSRLSLGDAPQAPQEEDKGPSLFQQAREGLRTSLQMPGIRVVIFAFGVGMFFGGIFNVIELPFATDALGTGVSGYSVLITVYGVGFVVGSLQGSRGGDPSRLKRRYLEGLLLTGLGSLAAGASVGLALAVAAFALGGYGNGLAVVHQRLLFQAEVAPSLQGRVFAVCDALMAWGFAVGFIAAGALAAASSPRPLLLIIGAGEVALAVATAAALKGQWTTAAPAPSDVVPAGEVGTELGGVRPDALGHAHVRQQGAHLIDGAGFWLTLLDDIGKRGDDAGVELGSGVRD